MANGEPLHEEVNAEARDSRKTVALEQIAESLSSIDSEMRKLNDHLFQIRHGGIFQKK